MTLTIGDLSALGGIGTAVIGLLFWALLGRLGKDFVAKEDHDAVITRLEAVEQKQSLAPNHDDFRAIVARVADMDRAVAVVGANVSNLKESMARIEHQLTLFVQAQLELEKRRGS